MNSFYLINYQNHEKNRLEVSDILKIIDMTGESDPPTQQSPPLIICHSKYYKIWMNYNIEPWTEMLCALLYICTMERWLERNTV